MKTILLVLALALTLTITGNAASKQALAKNKTENTVTAPTKSDNAAKTNSGKAKKHHAKKPAATKTVKKAK
jgi:ABC-type glycerol-3-phosphate transport system substrate-binding protein